MKDQTLDQFLDRLYLKLLTRKPTAQERELYLKHLSEGFDARIVKAAPKAEHVTRSREKYVSWSNHLDAEATTVRMEQEKAARQGDAPSAKLDPAWRNRLEDVLWAVLNAPEWAFSP